MKDLIDNMFSNEHEVGSFHDVLSEINPRKYTKEECRSAFNSLPKHIKFIAFEWGLSDTVFRDEAYVFLKDKEK